MCMGISRGGAEDPKDRRLAEVERAVGGQQDNPIVAYRASGARSGHAKSVLGGAGFFAVVNGGGFGSLSTQLAGSR
jgi:rhodanese-related sulfurtransferase